MPGRSKKELTEALRQLARSEPPRELSPGAMCYSVAGPTMHHEHICPSCGERTRYGSTVGGIGGWLSKAFGLDRSEKREKLIPLYGGTTEKMSVTDLDGARMLIREMGELPLSLDEKQYCRKCWPYLDQGVAPSAALIVSWPEGEHRCEDIVLDDLVLIRELIDGKDEHLGTFGRGKPLKSLVPRIEQLLGVSAGSGEL